MPFLAFSERLAALYTNFFRACGAKNYGFKSIVHCAWSAQNPGKQGGVLITWGFLINISTDVLPPVRLLKLDDLEERVDRVSWRYRRELPEADLVVSRLRIGGSGIARHL